MQNKRWVKRPEGSTWGDYGEHDQLGRLNLLTPEKVLQGIAEVKLGKTFCLSLPLDFPGGMKLNPRRKAPVLKPTLRDGTGDSNFNFPMRRLNVHNCDVMCDDAVLLHTQYSTQWDSLAHVGQWFDANDDGLPEMIYYNGYRAGEEVLGPVDYRGGKEAEWNGPTGALALGIENMAVTCVQGRAIMVDLAAHFASERARHYVTYDELMRIFEKDRIEVESGDMLCLRTGFDEWLLGFNRNPPARSDMNAIQIGLDGQDERLLKWITDSGVSALISDNIGVENSPPRQAENCTSLVPLHAHCLFKLGVPLGELWHLSPLADWLRKENRSRFLLTAPPLRLPGAVGSPVTPVATV